MSDLGLTIIWPTAGRYVVAVSGGVDSMVLLDVMTKASSSHNYDLVVAHFDHGIRTDSKEDLALIKQVAIFHQLPLFWERGNLANSSEATARQARYQYLEGVMEQEKANAILTAHHSDDQLETMILQLERGGGRRSLWPLEYHPNVVRPFLGSSRSEIEQYARANELDWREDSTNTDVKYARNFVRRRLIPAGNKTPNWHTNMRRIMDSARALNQELDSRAIQATYTRDQLDMLETVELEELVSSWGRSAHLQLNRTQVLLSAIQLRNLPSGSIDLTQGYEIALTSDTATFRQYS